jgi:heptosyltransferase-1
VPSKILIIKPSSLGDVVHTLPAVAAIREANSDAEITWVINPEWAPLLRGNRDVDHVHLFPRGEFRGFGAPARLLPWIRETSQLRPDVALDFQGLFRSALIARISGAKAILGMSDAREGSRLFYTQVARVDRREHAVDRYFKLAESFGAVLPRAGARPRRGRRQIRPKISGTGELRGFDEPDYASAIGLAFTGGCIRHQRR